MTQAEKRRFLIRRLLSEEREYRKLAVPPGADAQKRLLRSLLNVRPARAAGPDFLAVQDAYLREELRKKDVVGPEDLTPIAEGLYLWQGDITTLRCDAIVNAANSGMTGCYIPCHRCIDNCIHTCAGVQLRQECAAIMEAQGCAEKPGRAKITGAYNLPCKHILHTVGPIIRGRTTPEDRELLASCYRSCLTLAAEHGLESVAFCCISTGEFRFPNREAAEIAVKTVRQFLQEPTSVKKVIFNVFKDADYSIYKELLAGN